MNNAKYHVLKIFSAMRATADSGAYVGEMNDSADLWETILRTAIVKDGEINLTDMTAIAEKIKAILWR